MKKMIAMMLAVIAAIGALAEVDLALGFEEYAQGTALAEENCSALMLLNEYATLSVFDNGGDVVCAGGFTPPFTSAGTNAVRIKTTLGSPCAFGFKKNNVSVEISEGHPYCVDFLARFTAFDDVYYLPRSASSALLAKGKLHIDGEQLSILMVRPGFSCSIDDGIRLWQLERFDPYTDEPIGTNWCVTAGDGSGGVTNYVLTALGDEQIPDGDATECDGGSSGWHHITFKACRAAASDTLFFNLFIGGRQVRAGDTTDFPSMTAGTSVSSLRFDGQGMVDNIVACEEPPPEIRNVTAKQRWPWNGKVDISFDIVGDVEAGLPPDSHAALLITATNRVDGAIYVASASALSGDTGAAEGMHHVVWDLKAQGLEIKSDDVVFTVAYVEAPMVVVGEERSESLISFLYARPFRNHLDDDKIVPDILDRSEQPLAGESWGVQAKLNIDSANSAIDVSRGFKVTFRYFVGAEPWGFENWENEPNASREVGLKQVGDEADYVFRSTADRPLTIVPSTGTDGTVVQYVVTVKYYLKGSDVLYSEHITCGETDGWCNPEWYAPVDLNSYRGGAFSPYTILDTIAPGRVWINEVNYCDGPRAQTGGVKCETNQFIEVAVPWGVDLAGWRIVLTDMNHASLTLAVLGKNGVPSTKASTDSRRSGDYDFLVIQSPKTCEAGGIKDHVTDQPVADGTWTSDSLTSTFKAGSLQYDEPYQLELFRPSGILEHQVVVAGTNEWRTVPEFYQAFGYLYDGTNLVNELNEVDPSAKRFFAGEDTARKASNGAVWSSFGVFGAAHGENGGWTSEMKFTPGRLNEGQSELSGWYVRPNGFCRNDDPTVFCMADSTSTEVDLLDVHYSAGNEILTYSFLWDGDEDATVTIAQDGVAIVEGLTGEDTYSWSVQKAGTYVLTHTTYTNGVAGKVESATFDVPAKDIALAQVDVDCTDVTYRGVAYEPAMQSVKWGDDTLVAGADFTLAYSDNVDVGTATITLTGINFYNGTYTTNFTIRPRSLTQGMVGAIGNHPYTGKAQTPKPMVTDVELGVTLREEVEYTLSYANNTAIGKGIVTVTGKGNYTGSIARTFDIEPSTGSELEESLGGAGKAESDGKGGWIVTITNDVDAANLPIVIPDDLGNVMIDLNGHDLIGPDGESGGFVETALPVIRIVPGEGEGEPTVLTVVTTGGDAIVQGGDGAPAIEVADGVQEGVLINIGAGVTVQGGGVLAIDGTIGENNGNLVKVEVPVPAVQGKEYTGSQLQADISATERYTVQNDGGVDVGNYSVTLTLADSVNYCWAGGDSNPTTITFAVTKATNDWITKPTISGWVYGQQPNEPNMGEAKFGVASVVYSSMSQNAGTYTVTFSVAGTDNYEGLSLPVDFAIDKAMVGPGGGEEPGGGEVPEGGESKFDATAMYDAEGHTIDTNALVAAFGAAMLGESAVAYAVDDGSGEDGHAGRVTLPWLAEAPVYTNAGEYVVWYKVANPNYEDFVHAAKVTITNRPVTVTVTGHTAEYVYDGSEKHVEGFGLATDDELYDIATHTLFNGGIIDAALPNVMRTDVGTSYMGLAAPQFANADANFSVAYVVTDGWLRITKTAEQEALDEIFGGLPATVESDDEGGWIVALTGDISAEDLPIDVPDNLGVVTVDLNGHDLVGPDGGFVETALPVIRIVPGEGEGEPTQLTIVTSGGDGIVQGGEGAPAIEVADGVQEGVLVNIGVGVTVQGGDDFAPAIVGEVGTNEGTIVEPTRIHIPGDGTVTPPKSWKTGQRVTWKAAAAKGSVFAHWEGEIVESLGLSRNELRNPSLQFIVPAGFDTNQISAVFISIDDDGLQELSFRDGSGRKMGDEDGILLKLGEPVEFWLVDDSKSYVKATVSGLPSGLKFDAKTMKVTGTPKKSSTYWVQVKAKNASGYQWAEKVPMAVSGYTTGPKEPKLTRTAYHPLTVISSDVAAGTVSGTGVYAEGKKASISAKPARGRLFAGWYRDAALTKPMVFASGDYRKASQSVVVPEVRYLFARFVEATAVGDPITGLAAKGSGLVAESRFKWCVGVAVPEGDGVEYVSASLPSASATKLPAGVKFDAAKGCFAGVPTKAGTYKATVTVKNASKSKDVLGITIEVSALPAWAAGDFNGAVVAGARDARPYQGGDADARPYQGGDAENEVGSRVPRDLESEEPVGTVSLTVGATGKISGKILEGGKTWTLNAASFGRVEDVEGGAVFYATVIGKAGKEVVTNEVTVAAADGVGVATSQPFNLSTFQPFNFSWTAWQNLWKRADTKAAQPVFKKNIAIDLYLGKAGDANDRLQLTFKKDGVVAFSGMSGGTKVSGTSQVVMIGGFIETALPKWQVTLYAPPKGAFVGLCETIQVELELDEQNVVVGVATGE